ELFLFLTPHIISTDEDVDKMREAVKEGSELLKGVPGSRINPQADTMTIKRDSLTRRDTTIRRPPDSLTTLRRRPPVPPDTAGAAGAAGGERGGAGGGGGGGGGGRQTFLPGRERGRAISTGRARPPRVDGH